MEWILCDKKSGSLGMSVPVPDPFQELLVSLLRQHGGLLALDPYRDYTVQPNELDIAQRALSTGLEQRASELAGIRSGPPSHRDAQAQEWRTTWQKELQSRDPWTRLLSDLDALFALAREQGMPVRMVAD